MTIPCSSCRVGRLRERTMSYVEWHGRNLLIANRMPALVCDVCGERIYDDFAMESLQRLLWSERPQRGQIMPNSSRR